MSDCNDVAELQLNVLIHDVLSELRTDQSRSFSFLDYSNSLDLGVGVNYKLDAAAVRAVDRRPTGCQG